MKRITDYISAKHPMGLKFCNDLRDATKQCTVRNRREKHAKYESYIHSVTLPPQTSKAVVAMFNATNNEQEKLFLVKNQTLHLDQREQITVHTNQLTLLEANFTPRVKEFMAEAGIKEIPFAEDLVHTWLQLAVSHKRLQFAANEQQRKNKLKPIDKSKPMEEDATPPTVETLESRIKQKNKKVP